MARRRQIIEIEFSGGEEVHHISSARWIKEGKVPRRVRERSVAQVIRRIRAGKKYIVVDPDTDEVAEVVVAKRSGREYIRTTPDGDKNDNLLALDEF
jgi:hypothetical protein